MMIIMSLYDELSMQNTIDNTITGNDAFFDAKNIAARLHRRPLSFLCRALLPHRSHA